VVEVVAEAEAEAEGVVAIPHASEVLEAAPGSPPRLLRTFNLEGIAELIQSELTSRTTVNCCLGCCRLDASTI
jgi:hypothetical protein